MKRAALAAVVACSQLVLTAPVAQASGAGVCTITGTGRIVEGGASLTPSWGRFRVDRGTINCQGFLRGARITGPGPFRLTGIYGVLPPGGATCAADAAYGTIRFTIPTEAGNVEFDEGFVIAAVAVHLLTSPSLAGPVVLTPPIDGDCVARPITTFDFVATTALVADDRSAS